MVNIPEPQNFHVIYLYDCGFIKMVLYLQGKGKNVEQLRVCNSRNSGLYIVTKNVRLCRDLKHSSITCTFEGPWRSLMLLNGNSTLIRIMYITQHFV